MKLRNLIQVGVILAISLISANTLISQWIYLGLNNEIITTVCPDPNNNDIIFAGSIGDFVQGTVGKVFRSINSGTTWDTLLSGVRVTDILVSPFNSNTIYVTTSGTQSLQPGIINSTNGGQNWSRCDSGIYFSSEVGARRIAMSPIDSNVIFLATGGPMGGWVYKTINGGKNWYPCIDTTMAGLGSNVAKIILDSDSLQYLFAINSYYGDLIKSTDYGESWNITKEQLAYATDMEFGEDRYVIYISSDISEQYPKGFYKSTDNGSHWENLGNGFIRNHAKIMSLALRRKEIPNGIYVSGFLYNQNEYNPKTDKVWGIFYSSDGGYNWEHKGLDSLYIESVELSSDENTLYAGVFSSFGQSPSGLYKLDLTTDVLDDVLKIPLQFSLMHNYPNPFNPSTQITFSVLKATDVTLKVYDILGREVAVLVNERKQAGEYNVTWNAEGVPSGVYFYRIVAGDFIETKKMVVVR